MSTAFPEQATWAEEVVAPAHPWKVVVSNDPVNLVPLVIVIFQRVLEVSEEVATDYTMRVHHEGRCVVFSGSEEECRAKAEVLMSFHLWTHVEKGA